MNSESNHSINEKIKIYETVLSSPGMSEKCKVLLHLSRQNILLLSRIIEFGLETDKKEMKGDIISLLVSETLEEFRVIVEEILQKGGLTEFYRKLKSL